MPSEDRIRQVETTKARHGADHYKNIGSTGGKNSPTKFNTESAKLAAQRRWAAYREAKLNETRKEQDGKTQS